MEIKRWKHQAQALERSYKEKHLALFWDMGTGKTRTTIDIIRHKCAQNKRLLKTVIFCPKIVCENWKREFAKYSKIHPYDVLVLLGSEKKRLKTFLDKTEGDKPKILVLNYEASLMNDLFHAIETWGIDVMVLDEAHRIKNPTSKRAKKVLKLAEKVKYKYALTGTPILNSSMDLFNIFKFLDNGKTFGKSFYIFRSQWFEDENARWSNNPNHFPKYVPRLGTYEAFNKLVQAKAIRVKKEECLDLPPLVRKQVFVDMSTEQKKLYDSMKKEYLAYLDNLSASGEKQAVVATLAVTKALRLQQIVTGYAKTDKDEIHKIKNNPRLDALKELLEDITPESKVIVWSVFKENYSDIASVCESLGIEYRELHGGVKDADREEAVDMFNNDSKVRVLIANQGAAGIGINLVSSDCSIYYSKNFSLEHDLQSEARNYRGGSEIHEKVTRIDLVCKDSIDELIDVALSKKEDIGTKILDWRDDL
jgi:SNF2 family DNA or RNA helicase